MKRSIQLLPRIAMTLAVVCMLWAQAAPAYAISSQDTSIAIGAIVGCSSQIKDGVNYLSNQLGFGNIFGSDNGSSSSGTGTGNSVAVNSSAIQSNTANTADAAKATQKKLKCENALAKAAAQEAIKDITKKTTGWVNGGFQGGKPVFVSDEQSFLQQIKNQAINAFTSELMADSDNLPFGRIVAQGIVTSLKTSFADQNKYTLDDVIKNATGNASATSKDFQDDFSNGGWDAFDAQFQSQNNPFGFSMIAQDVAANAMTNNAKVQQTKDELQRNQGFLDLKKCTDTNASGTCNHYETQTPGSIVVAQLDTVLGSPIRQLENGQDLSADISKVFDALIDQLMTKGLSYLSATDKGTTYINNEGLASNTSITINGTGDDWYNQDGTFDITTDLPGLIKKLQDYLTIVQQEGTTNDTQLPNNGRGVIQDIMDNIYQLDYCIPGPNPLWQQNGNQVIQALISALPSNASDALPADPTLVTLAKKIYGNDASSVGWILDKKINVTFGFVTTSPPKESSVDINGVLNAASGGTDVATSQNKRVYWALVRIFTGVNFDNDGSDIQTKQQAATVIQTIWQRYSEAMNARYNLGTLPPEANPASHSYKNLETLAESLQTNEDAIASGKALIHQLDQLNKRVLNLPAKDDPTYPRLLAGINNIFSVISQDIPSSDTINGASANLQYLQSQLDTLNNPIDGYLPNCVAETSPTAPKPYTDVTTRVAYPDALAKNIYNYVLSKSFLPDYSYDGPLNAPAPTGGSSSTTGTSTTTSNPANTIKVNDLVDEVTGDTYVTSKLRNNKIMGNYFATAKNEDVVLRSRAEGLSVFDRLIGAY